jgi:hypothetical protein
MNQCHKRREPFRCFVVVCQPRFALVIFVLHITYYPRGVGKPISQEELFDYTNGHFLINEQIQRRRRYVKFNLERLCEIAAAVGSSKSPINVVEKLEGGFSKALLMTREDGTKVIAKIPCANAGPPLYTTAAEVAVLKYGNNPFSVDIVPPRLTRSSQGKYHNTRTKGIRLGH